MQDSSVQKAPDKAGSGSTLPRTSPEEMTEVQTMIGISFNLPAAIPYIGSLRKAMCHLLNAAGVPQEEIDDLELVVGELATNAARHAQGDNYRVEFEIHGDQATITVTDNGIGFDPGTLPEPGSERADDLGESDALRIGGYGLPLVHTLTDHVRIERNNPTGMVVQAKKTVRWTGKAQEC